MVMNHSPESVESARSFAEQIGFKVRVLQWPSQKKRGFNLADLAAEDLDNFKAEITRMVSGSKAFSPFHSPQHEYEVFVENIGRRQSESYQALQTGMAQFDDAVGGIYGLNMIGGPPKAGKSCLGIQIGTEISNNKMGVI